MRFVDITVESWKFLGVNTGKGKNLFRQKPFKFVQNKGGKIYGEVLKRQWEIKRTAAILEQKILKILRPFLAQNSMNKQYKCKSEIVNCNT